MSELPDYFKEFPPEPDEMSVSNAIARLIDGLGFRLYRTLDGLREEDCSFRPAPTANSIHDILWHILGLVNWVYMHVYGEQMHRPKNIIDQGHETLRALEKLRKHLIEIDDAQLSNYKLEDRSFWAFINMPLSDALHHEGEVRILRHAAGNPPKQRQR
jgi:uncharacterized damage-inducible protein DinB